MGRALTKEEISQLLAQTNERIENFAVGFVKIEDNEEDASLLGSGTLVTFAGRNAILTADHVLQVLPRIGELGLVLPQAEPRLHRSILYAENTESHSIARASRDCNGPDLGLLLLAKTDANRLANSKIFYNLEKRRDRILSTPPAIDSGGWFLVGMGAEWTEDLAPERGFPRVKLFRGISGAGVVTVERQDGKYDYLNFEAKYGPSYQGPGSFQGFSGGGLWQIQLKENDGKLELVDVLLSGVAFYESEVVDNIRTIFCHGRRSIYEHICNALANESAFQPGG